MRFNGFRSGQASLTVNRAGVVTDVDTDPAAQLEYLSEGDIVRDLLFVFQGIQGSYIQYTSAEDAFTLRPNLVVSHSTRKIVNELCELGWLYKKVNEWLKL